MFFFPTAVVYSLFHGQILSDLFSSAQPEKLMQPEGFDSSRIVFHQVVEDLVGVTPSHTPCRSLEISSKKLHVIFFMLYNISIIYNYIFFSITIHDLSQFLHHGNLVSVMWLEVFRAEFADQYVQDLGSQWLQIILRCHRKHLKKENICKSKDPSIIYRSFEYINIY